MAVTRDVGVAGEREHTHTGGAGIQAQLQAQLQVWRARGVAAAQRISRRQWFFVAVLVLCYAYFISPANTNTISRYDMVYALGHGTAIIDAHHDNSIDVSFYRGHYYSPRSLGLSLLAVPIFEVMRLLDSSVALWQNTTGHIGVLSAFTVLPAALLAVLVFQRFLGELRPAIAATRLPLLVTTAFALGTLFFPFATVFFSHAFGGALAFLSFYLLYRARAQRQPTAMLVAAGLLLGIAIISEYPIAVILVALTGYVWASFAGQRLRALVLFALGLAPGALLLGGYNWFAFGNPLHLSYEFVAGAQFAGQHQGLFGITLPSPAGLEQILAWPRGLLVESPFLLLVPLGFWRWLRSGARPSAEAVTCLAISIAYPLLIASYYLPMAGENLPGPRLLVPMLPFACLALGWSLDGWGAATRWLRRAFAAMLAFGVLLSFIYVASGVREDHTYLTYPFTDLYAPILGTGFVPGRNGPTPPNLGSAWLHLPQGLSIYLALVPLVAWTAYSIVALLRQRGSAWDDAYDGGN